MPDDLSPTMHLSTLPDHPTDRNRHSRSFRLPEQQAFAPPAEESDPGCAGETRDRYATGIKTDWAELIDSRATLPLHITLEEVQQFFRSHEKDKFAAVLDGDRIVGLCSELGISRKLTVSRGLGYHVYAKTHLERHLEPAFLVIRRGEPVREVLHRVMSRGEGFFDDIILTAADGAFLGLIHTRTMMLLQHRISQQQVQDLESLTLKLRDNNIELERARDTAVQAAEMKSSFLANMSHEIRTPLNGILGMIKILMRTGLAPEQRRYASTVLNSANALLAILNDILDFSKIEAGKMTLEQIPFDLSDVVEECVQLLSERAREKKIQLISWTDVHARTRVVSDSTRLRQVILNLVSNSVKFTEQGEVVVRIEQERETPTHTTLRVSVRDTGIGIPDNVRTRLFQPFEQGDRSTNRKFGGTGLGLAICKKIIDLLGGNIGCDSTPGEGSNFWFTLELPKQPDPDHATTGRREDELWGMRMLIADASPTFGSYLEQHLGRWKVVSRVTRTSTEAFELARSQAERGTPFDVVITDHPLQPVDGLELAQRFRNDPLLSRTRFILLTAFDHEIQPEVIARHGIVGTVSKPVKPSSLYDALVSCVRRATPADAVPDSTPASSVIVRPTPASEAPPVASTSTTPVYTPALAVTSAEKACPPLHLLLVEDSEVNREVALLLLESWGHTLDTAANGRIAVEMLRTRRYDGVLMDCQMPDMDGYEATRVIRAPSSGVLDHKVPVVAMTANAMPGDRETCLVAGMDDYVGKPIDENELLQALLRVADRKKRPTDTINTPLPAPQPIPAPTPAPACTEPMAGSLNVTTALASLERPKPLPEDDEPYFPARLMNLFLQETGARLDDLRSAAARDDLDVVQRIAHTIKGTAGNFRAHRLYELMRDMEKHAREGNADVLTPLISRAGEAFLDVKQKFTPSPTTNPTESPLP